MAQSKVTHIYPIKQGFEKTRIGLQLMLQWGPESERCYRTERLEFQGSCEQKAVQSSERKGRKRGLGGGVGAGLGREVASDWREAWGLQPAVSHPLTIRNNKKSRHFRSPLLHFLLAM